MQPDNFEKIAVSLKEKEYRIDCNVLAGYLDDHYQTEQLVHPDKLQEILGVSTVDTYRIMEICVDAGLAEQCLQICCPACHRFKGDVYKSVFDVPDNISCEHCGNEIESPIGHAVVIYKACRMETGMELTK